MVQNGCNVPNVGEDLKQLRKKYVKIAKRVAKSFTIKIIVTTLITLHIFVL